MMNTANGRERGAALALVVIFGLVLSILAAAVFTLFQSNVSSYTYVRDRIQARYSAEAGVNLAVHMIMGGADIPQDSMPIQFLPVPPAGGYYDMPGDDIGRVLVYVDPNDNNDQVATANAYAIRALAEIGTGDSTYTYGMETMVLPENFARFATFLNEPPLDGFYGDGYRFDGPFFANGPVCLYSSSGSSTDDIWFYRFSLASDYYIFGTNGSGSPQTSPQHSTLTVQPIERMVMGEPYFELGVDPIPFGPDEVNWEDARNAAISGGLYFSAAQIPNGTRMILHGSEYGDTLLVKTSEWATVQRFFLGDLTNRVIWIDNANSSRIYLKSYPNYSPWSNPISPEGLREPLTIGCNGSIYASGPLQYYDRDIMDMENRTLLGLVIVHGNFVIAVDPDHNPTMTDWSDGLWRIVTNSDVEYDCTVMVLEGDFVAQDPRYPNPKVDFMFVGGYIVNGEGYTTYPGTGWDTVIYYDSRLMTMHPPFFPQTGRWDTAYWEEQPDLTESLIGVNRN